MPTGPPPTITTDLEAAMATCLDFNLASYDALSLVSSAGPKGKKRFPDAVCHNDIITVDYGAVC
jgi:hypothetical protein